MSDRTVTEIEQWWENIDIADELLSTNTKAREMAVAGAPHGSVIAARRQTLGYGKQQRVWASPEGGLWFSIILRPPHTEGLSLLFSLWVMEFLESHTGVNLELYWPNDVYMEGRKLGGILLEGVCNGSGDGFVVAGIGLNINNAPSSIPEEFNAVSLISRTGKEINLDYLLEDLIMHLQFNYETASNCGFKAFLDEIILRCPMIGKTVEIFTEEGSYRAVVSAIGEKGQLVITDDSGRIVDLWACEKIRVV